jgi:hypothetical protein
MSNNPHAFSNWQNKVKVRCSVDGNFTQYALTTDGRVYYRTVSRNSFGPWSLVFEGTLAEATDRYNERKALHNK